MNLAIRQDAREYLTSETLARAESAQVYGKRGGSKGGVSGGKTTVAEHIYNFFKTHIEDNDASWKNRISNGGRRTPFGFRLWGDAKGDNFSGYSADKVQHMGKMIIPNSGLLPNTSIDDGWSAIKWQLEFVNLALKGVKDEKDIESAEENLQYENQGKLNVASSNTASQPKLNTTTDVKVEVQTYKAVNDTQLRIFDSKGNQVGGYYKRNSGKKTVIVNKYEQ